jgi:chromate transporter
MPASFEVARFRRQNVARAPELVNNTSHASGSPAHAAARSGSTADVFAAFLRLGLTSFGGPIAHLGCLHEEFAVRRKWLDEKTYVDLVALSQFLPRPASSKVGIAFAAIARRLCGGAGRRGWSSRSARSAARR